MPNRSPHLPDQLRPDRRIGLPYALFCHGQFGCSRGGVALDLRGSASHAQLSQTPVKDIVLIAGRTQAAGPAVVPSWRLPPCGPRRVSIQVLQARRVCICSSVASSGVPRTVPSPHSKWLQSGVMPQPRHGSGRCAVEVDRIDHVPDVWMFHRARHRNTLRAITLQRCGLSSSWLAEHPQLPLRDDGLRAYQDVSGGFTVAAAAGCGVPRRMNSHRGGRAA